MNKVGGTFAFGAALAFMALGCPDKGSKTESTSDTSDAKRASQSDSGKEKKPASSSAAAPEKKDTVAASAQPAAPSAAPAPAGKPPSALAGRQIDAGNVASGAWVDTFHYERAVHDDASTLTGAAAACKAKGFALCTTEQFERACAADAAVGDDPTWTGSFDSSGKFIVRGPTCAASTASEPSAKIDGAALSCCSRAVSIDSANKNVAFLRTTGSEIVKFEQASQKADYLTLQGILAPRMDFYGAKNVMNVAMTITDASKAIGDLWMVHDHCTIELTPDAQVWKADCDKANFQNGKLSADVTHYEYVGVEHVFNVIQEAKIVRNPAPP